MVWAHYQKRARNRLDIVRWLCHDGSEQYRNLKLVYSSRESPTKLDKRWLAKLEPPTFRYTADMYRNGSPIG